MNRRTVPYRRWCRRESEFHSSTVATRRRRRGLSGMSTIPVVKGSSLWTTRLGSIRIITQLPSRHTLPTYQCKGFAVAVPDLAGLESFDPEGCLVYLLKVERTKK